MVKKRVKVPVKKWVKVLVNVVIAKVGGRKEEEEEEKLPFCWLAPLRLAGASKNAVIDISSEIF